MTQKGPQSFVDSKVRQSGIRNTTFNAERATLRQCGREMFESLSGEMRKSDPLSTLRNAGQRDKGFADGSFSVSESSDDSTTPLVDRAVQAGPVDGRREGWLLCDARSHPPIVDQDRIANRYRSRSIACASAT